VGRHLQAGRAAVITLHAWGAFYGLTGAAAATLIGLIFIAISLRAGQYTDDHRMGMRVYTSPISMHFGCVLAISLIALAPVRPVFEFGLLVVVAILTTIHAVWVLVHLPQMDVADSEDICWYGVAPLVAHLVLLAGALLALFHLNGGPNTIGGATAALLLISIRNVWDIMVWAVLNPLSAAKEKKE
jgi:hypothetical protein